MTDARNETLEDGKSYLVQWFERVRMEYHPENAPPNDVLLGQFGRRIHPADPPVAEKDGHVYFAATGHNMAPDLFAFWDANGGLPQFGYPLSAEIHPGGGECASPGQRRPASERLRARPDPEPGLGEQTPG